MRRIILFLFSILLIGSSSIKTHSVNADFINHKNEEVASEGLNIVETGPNAKMVFTDLKVNAIPQDSYFAFTITTLSNMSPSLIDPYIYLQFSFNNSGEENKLYFDVNDSEIKQRIIQNSLYYSTTEADYKCPNRYYNDSSYWFLIKVGFSGTIYVPMSDYFKNSINIDSLTIFSDGMNHFNKYELYDLSFVDDMNNKNKKQIVDLSTLSYEDDFTIDDPDLVFENQIVKVNTTITERIISAHIDQSRLTMLNIKNEIENSSTSDLEIKLDKDYKTRDAIILNINNLSISTLKFTLSLIDKNDNIVDIVTTVDKKYALGVSDDLTINASCDGEFVVIPSQTFNSTIMFKISDFTGNPTEIKGIKLVFLNDNLDVEVGKIIDAENTLTGNFKTLFNPKSYNETELSIIQPLIGTKVFTHNINCQFKWNEESIYCVQMIYSEKEGFVEKTIINDDVVFTLSPKPGYIVDKVYINNKLASIADNEVKICLTNDIVFYAVFKAAEIDIVLDNISNAAVLCQTTFNEVNFKVYLMDGYVIDKAIFNGRYITFDSSNNFYVSKNEEKYNLEIFTRKASLSIESIDQEGYENGNVTTTLKNNKLYFIFNPNEGYELSTFIINAVKIEFTGVIYSIDFNKDIFAQYKFAKKGN